MMAEKCTEQRGRLVFVSTYPSQRPNEFFNRPIEREMPCARVYCSRTRGADLRKMKHEVSAIADNVKRAADSNGNCLPSIVLFAENALRYAFNIPHDETMKQAELMLASFPKDMQFAAAFTAMVKDGNEKKTVGYLVSAEGVKHAPKRALTSYDIRWLKSYEQQCAWKQRWHMMNEKAEPYPSAAFAGMRIEHRICADALDIAGLAVHEPSTLTVVSAEGLREQQIGFLLKKRAGIILNDGHMCALRVQAWENEGAGVQIKKMDH